MFTISTPRWTQQIINPFCNGLILIITSPLYALPCPVSEDAVRFILMETPARSISSNQACYENAENNHFWVLSNAAVEAVDEVMEDHEQIPLFPSFEFQTAVSYLQFYTAIYQENYLTSIQLSGFDEIIIKNLDNQRLQFFYLRFLWPLSEESFTVISGGSCELIDLTRDMLVCTLDSPDDVLRMKTRVPLDRAEGMISLGASTFPADSHSEFTHFPPDDKDEEGNSRPPRFLIIQSVLVNFAALTDRIELQVTSFFRNRARLISGNSETLSRSYELDDATNNLLKQPAQIDALTHPPRHIAVFMNNGEERSWGDTPKAKPKARQSQRRGRKTTFTPYQLQEMERIFAINRYPNAVQREELGTRLALTSERIQVWFQNRRAKYKRQGIANPQSGAVNPLLPPSALLSVAATALPRSFYENPLLTASAQPITVVPSATIGRQPSGGNQQTLQHPLPPYNLIPFQNVIHIPAGATNVFTLPTATAFGALAPPQQTAPSGGDGNVHTVMMPGNGEFHSVSISSEYAPATVSRQFQPDMKKERVDE